jgi:endonuclease-3
VKKPTPKASPLEILNELRKAHPDAHCELVHENAYQLLVATVLSAQTTDVAVNKATPALFAAYPTPEALAKASAEDVEQKLSTIGMFRQKTKNVMKLASMLVEKHRGEVPRSLDALVELPGVGRKTANVVLGVIWGTPDGVVVDTHVQRLSQRLGFTKETEPEKIERALCDVLPRETWDITSHTLIFHGRRVCFARKPACETCTVNTLCPSAFEAEEVGRKPKRERVPPVAEAAKKASKKAAAKPPSKKTAAKPPSKSTAKKAAPKKPGKKGT